MHLSNQKILITGGSSGVGLELSKQLIEKGNTILICGRSLDKLLKAKALYPEVEFFQCDLAQTSECERLVEWIKTSHKDLTVLINNAAVVHKEDFLADHFTIDKAELEMQTNFFAPLRLIKKLNEVLTKQVQTAIVNVTTGLVYAPKAKYSIYNSTKAALHAFTQVFRLQNEHTNLKVIEALLPVVDTPWHEGNPPDIAITAQQAAREIIQGIENKQSEIKVGGVKILHLLSRIAPKFALKKINAL